MRAIGVGNTRPGPRRSGLFCPGPSTLIGPSYHSQAHRDFAVLRLIRDASLAVRLSDHEWFQAFTSMLLSAGETTPRTQKITSALSAY